MKPATPIRILKIGSCPSLAGKGKLTYHIGCTDKSEVQFRVYANTGGGFFNNDWSSLDAIQQVLDKHPSSKPLTSHVLNPLFRGQSANTPGFLLSLRCEYHRIVQCNMRCGPLGEVSQVGQLLTVTVTFQNDDCSTLGTHQSPQATRPDKASPASKMSESLRQ